MENSVKAFERARELGASMIETDIYENADGTLIISHDPNIFRVTGINQNIATLTDASMKSITLKD